jgi:hypothetical protein
MSISAAAHTAAMEIIQPRAIKAARDASAQAPPTQKAAVYTRTLEKYWSDHLPIVERQEYARLITENLK